MAKPISLEDRAPEDRFPFSLNLKVKHMVALRQLIEAYDPLMSTNIAILKMIDWAIKEHWIPGYERKPLDKDQKKGYKEGSEIIKEVK